jgi:pimeloyl-ACP methyl ester carboxylesterase
MRFLRELAEPWGVLLAATSAGAAWAVQLPVAAAAGVGAVVLVSKAAIAAWQSRDDKGPEPPQIEPRSEEAKWVRRAEDAADDFDSLSRSLSPGPLADQVKGMESSVDETLETLRRLAGRASTTAQAMRRIDPGALAEERQQLQRRRRGVGGEDVEKSLGSLERQQAVYDRLSTARAKLLAQLTAGAHGLEELVARLVELEATADVAFEPGGSLDELTDQLEGLRRGVAETDEATRRSLGQL